MAKHVETLSFNFKSQQPSDGRVRSGFYESEYIYGILRSFFFVLEKIEVAVSEGTFPLSEM